MGLNWISLLVLVLVIFVGVYKKMNPGFIAIGVAFILGTVGGMDGTEIINGFGTSLFIMLLGVMFLFGVAQVNGTIELLAKKILAVTGRKSNLIPIVIYFVCIFIAAIGPGCIPTLAIMSVFCIALAKEMNISPMVLAPIGYLGTTVGGLSPLASTGIIGNNLALQQGVEQAAKGFIPATFVSATAVVIFLYIYYGGYKIKVATPFNLKELPKFNTQQKITLLGILVLVLTVIITGWNVGLLSFIIGTVLILLGAAKEKEVLGSIAWGTIILVCGFGVLMTVIVKLEGILLLSKLLSSIMNDAVAPAIMSFTASILGMFSSTSGVVMPTLIATSTDIANAVGGSVTPSVLISAIIAGAHIGGLSPIAGGGLLLSAYASVGKATEDEQRKMYTTLFKLGVIGAFIGAVVALTGVYRLF